MPRFNLAEIASNYSALNHQIADAKKPQNCMVAMRRLDLLVATHFGELLQHAERQQTQLDQLQKRFDDIRQEHEDLQAQLLAAQGGLLDEPRGETPRPPVAEAAGDVHGESDDPNTPDNADHTPD